MPLAVGLSCLPTGREGLPVAGSLAALRTHARTLLPPPLAPPLLPPPALPTHSAYYFAYLPAFLQHMSGICGSFVRAHPFTPQHHYRWVHAKHAAVFCISKKQEAGGQLVVALSPVCNRGSLLAARHLGWTATLWTLPTF